MWQGIGIRRGAREGKEKRLLAFVDEDEDPSLSLSLPWGQKESWTPFLLFRGEQGAAAAVRLSAIGSPFLVSWSWMDCVFVNYLARERIKEYGPLCLSFPQKTKEQVKTLNET